MIALFKRYCVCFESIQNENVLKDFIFNLKISKLFFAQIWNFEREEIHTGRQIPARGTISRHIRGCWHWILPGLAWDSYLKFLLNEMRNSTGKIWCAALNVITLSLMAGWTSIPGLDTWLATAILFPLRNCTSAKRKIKMEKKGPSINAIFFFEWKHTVEWGDLVENEFVQWQNRPGKWRIWPAKGALHHMIYVQRTVVSSAKHRSVIFFFISLYHGNHVVLRWYAEKVRWAFCRREPPRPRRSEWSTFWNGDPTGHLPSPEWYSLQQNWLYGIVL